MNSHRDFSQNFNLHDQGENVEIVNSVVRHQKKKTMRNAGNDHVFQSDEFPDLDTHEIYRLTEQT